MTPYLSVVLGIGGHLTDDLLARLGASLRTNYAPDTEVVIVEWNVSLRDFGRVAASIKGNLMPVRIIHTPRELHAALPNKYGFRYFEMAPKNIGIRRALGEFVLCTNPDGLWSPALAEFFGRQELKHGHFYRVNRHDTRDGKTFCICYPTGGHSPNDTEEQIKMPSSPRASAWHENILHFNAAGDFTLMSKDDWHLIHGNPERDYNDTVDGQTIWLAHKAGLKQVILPYELFHPDHERTLNVSEVMGRHVGPLWDDNKPFAKENGEDWGYAGLEFEETSC